ncbi:MAG: YafY family transcriptional regulator [Silicimonas sp.]|nr:YafY family transcriptional regulator [Silicimonas sp.]
MRRAHRLFQIVQHLRGGRLTTARALAEKLEVSERTIYRDIADLIGSGVPVEGEAGVGYVMREGFDLPPLMFTRDEIVALVAGARLIRAWGGAAMAAAAEEALIKIGAVLPDDARARAEAVQVHAFQMPELDDRSRQLLDRIESATDARTRLTLEYSDEAGARTERDVRPLGLWFWGKVWTLVAWCELRNDFRMFRVDRIAHMSEGDRFRAERDKSLAAFYAMNSHARPDR